MKAEKSTPPRAEAPAVYTVRELAALLRVHPNTIYRGAELAEIPGAVKVRGCWRFSVEAVRSWLGQGTSEKGR